MLLHEFIQLILTKSHWGRQVNFTSYHTAVVKFEEIVEVSCMDSHNWFADLGFFSVIVDFLVGLFLSLWSDGRDTAEE